MVREEDRLVCGNGDKKRRMAERSLLLIVYRVAEAWAKFGGNVLDLMPLELKTSKVSPYLINLMTICIN